MLEYRLQILNRVLSVSLSEYKMLDPRQKEELVKSISGKRYLRGPIFKLHFPKKEELQQMPYGRKFLSIQRTAKREESITGAK